MKILFAIKKMDDAPGGAERVLACIASGLAALGHQVCIISFDRMGGESFYPLGPTVRRIRLGIGDSAERATVMETLRRIPALRRAVLAEKPDIAVGFMHSMFVPLAVALAGSGVPVVASEHIVPQHYETRKIDFLLLRLAVKLCRAVTVTAESVRALYPAVLRGKIHALANPVSLQTRMAQPDGPGHIILSVGRLDPQKDQATLIAAFARLAPRFPQWSLRIVGEGPLRDALEQQILGLGLEGCISLPGAARDIANEYAAAQLFVLPSRYESFGLATAEAMASGLPVIGFADCTGTTELIADGRNGILVGAGDRVEMLAEAMERMMNDPAQRARYGAEGTVRAKAYNPERIVADWESFLRRMTGQ